MQPFNIAFKAKIAQIKWSAFLISEFFFLLLKFWINLYRDRYINISFLEFLQGRIFFARTGPLKESERSILYRPFIYKVF